MEKHIADNLTYRNVLSDMMAQRIQEYMNNAAERKILAKDDEASKDLYVSDYEQWKIDHSEQLSEALNAMNGNAIPQIFAKNINNAATSADDSLIVTGVRKVRAPQYEDIDTESVIGSIGTQNLYDIADPNHDGGSNIAKSNAQLNYQHTNWRVAQSDADMIAGIQNAEQKGEFVAWDSETVGGQDKYGKQRYDGVTEITFKRKKYTSGAETTESFGSAIGFTQKQKEYAEQVYKKVQAGAKLTGQESVWAHRLMLIGQSTAEQAKGKARGVYEYSHFADKDEIADQNPEYIRQGIDKGFALGEAQRKAGANVAYAGQRIYAWESEIFKGIDTIVDNDLTAVGHNTVNFDRKALQWLLQHGMWSTGAKKLAEERLQRLTAKNGDLHFDHEVDTEAVQNQHSETRLDNYLTTDNDGKIAVDEKALKYAKDRGLTLGQQESIGHALYPDMYDDADVNAHTSDVDVDVVGKMFTSSKYRLGTEDSFFKNVSEASTTGIKGDGSQLFYMTRSHTSADLSKNGLLGFVMDDLSADAFTSFEGIAHDAENARKLIYKPGALQKGVSYAITNVSALSLSKDLQEQIARVQPDADMSKLIAVEWAPQYDENVDPGMRKARKVVTVGARFNQETLINESGLMYATKQNGQWQFTDDKEINNLLQIRMLGDDGRLLGARNATVEDMLVESSESLRDGGALRALREHSLKKDIGLLQYANDMKAWGEKNGTDDLEKRFYDAVASGNTSRSLADYFGYTKDGQKLVESPTVSAAMNRLDFVQRNEKTIRAAAERSLMRAGSGQTVDDLLASDISNGVDNDASHYYKKFMEAITDAAKENIGGGDKSNVGIVNKGAHVFELNSVEIDMNGFAGRYDYNDPFRINLNAGGKTNFKELAQYLGKHPDMAEDQAVALLADFQKFLANSSSLKQFGATAAQKIKDEQTGNFRITGNNNVDAAFSKIAYSLIHAKKENPSGGMLTSTERYNLLAHKSEFGLSDKQREEVLNSAYETVASTVKGSKEASEVFGREATNKILYGGVTDIEAVKQKFMEFGYSEHDATKAAYIREQQRRDTQELMTKVAQAVSYHGGNMGMDAKSGTIWVEANGKKTVLNRMPQNVMENGLSFIKSGNMSFHAPVGLYATNRYAVEKGTADKLNYKFMSKIGAEFAGMKGYMSSSFERSARRGELGEGVQDFISTLANRVSQSASILAQDFQEMRMGGDVNIGGILPLIARDDVWNEVSHKIDFEDPYTGEANRALRDAVEKIQKSNSPALPDDYKAFSTDVGITTAIRDIMPDLHKYLDSDSQDIMRKILGDSYQDFSIYTKAAGKGMINAYEDMDQFGDNLVSRKRGAPEFSGRVNKFYTDGEALDGKLAGVEFGHAFNTEIGRIYGKDSGEGVSRAVDDIVRAKRIRATTGTIKEVAGNSALTEQTRDMLFGTHLNEGASILNPRYVDAFWTHSKAMQRVRDNRVIDIVDDTIDHLNEKNKMAAHVKVNADGSIGFKYSNGLYVETTEISGVEKSPLNIKGMNNAAKPLEIKEDGFMRFGYFSRKNNLLVSEEDVQKVLNRQENVARIAQAADKAQEAFRILNEHFDAYYYNESVDARSLLKLEEFREKGMHDALFGYLGTGGRTAAERAEDDLMKKALGNLGVNELMEFIPSKSMIESLKSDNIANTVFGIYLNAKTGKEMTHQEIINKMTEGMGLSDAEKAGFNKRLFDIAVRERYNPWDETIDTLKDPMKIGDAEAKEIASISNFADGVIKHADMPTNAVANGLIDETIDAIKDSAGVNISQLQEAAKGLGNSRTFWTGNGKTLSDEAYQALSDKEKAGFTKNVTSISTAELAQADDYDRERLSDSEVGKKWKYDYRSQAMSSIDRYSEEHLKDIQSGLITALGDEEGTRIFKEHFGNAKVGARTGEGFYQDLERSRWYTPDQKRVLIHGDLDQSLLTPKEQKEIEKAYEHLRSVGIDDSFTNAVVAAAKRGYKDGDEFVKGSNADYVSVDKVKAHYSLNQHILAAQYNNGNKTMEEVTKAGFGSQVISMNELFTPNSNFEEVAGHLYGKSAFLDLQMNGGKGPQVYEDESKRFVALPWTDQNLSAEDGEVLKNQYQKYASSMLNSVNRLQSGVDENGNPLSETQKQKLRDTISGYADDMRKAIVENAFDKDGIVHRKLGTAYVGMSSFNKAYGHQLWGNETGFWGNIEFDGHNLSKLAKDGNAVVDYQVGSLSLRSRFFNDKYFEQFGLSGADLDTFKQDLWKRLETSGTLSTNSRNPQGYDKSTSAAAMYFNKAVTGNNLAVSAAMWESKKGDYDADEAISHVLAGDVIVTKNGKKTVAKVDYATFSLMKDMAETGAGGITDVTASSHTEAMWADAKSQIWGQSVTRNKLADKNARDTSTEVGAEFDYSYMDKETLEGKGSHYTGDKHLIDGRQYRGIDAGERTVLRSQYTGFMEQAQNWKGISADTFEKMDAAEQRNLYAGYVSKRFGMESDQGKTAMNALGFVMTEHRELQDAVARKRNAAAGQMNNAVFRLFQVADASGQFAEDGTIRGIGAIHTALNEAFLSPKNEAGINGVEDINKLTAAANDVYRLISKSNPNKSQIQQADKALEDIAYNVLEGRNFKELDRYVPGFEEKRKALQGDAQKQFIHQFVHETFGSIGSKINAAGFDMNAFDIGMKNGKTYTSNLEIAYGGMKHSSMNDMVLQDAAFINEQVGSGVSVMKQNTAMNGNKDYQHVIEAGKNYESNVKQYAKAYVSDTNSPLRDSAHAKPPTLGDLGHSATRALSHIKISGGSVLKAAAVAAGGLAVSGYAGGVDTTSPKSAPQSATTQAAGASEALQEAQVPNLSDGNMNVLRGGPQSGYVINISASSPQGSDAARSAITQALGSSVPVNTSMNINMNTNYQDQVNQLQISRMISNML